MSDIEKLKACLAQAQMKEAQVPYADLKPRGGQLGEQYGDQDQCSTPTPAYWRNRLESYVERKEQEARYLRGLLRALPEELPYEAALGMNLLVK